MQDDFDSRMGIPDDELAGSGMSDMGDAAAGTESDEEGAGEPGGRPSGGARARKASSGASPQGRQGRRRQWSSQAPPEEEGRREEGREKGRREEGQRQEEFEKERRQEEQEEERSSPLTERVFGAEADRGRQSPVAGPQSGLMTGD